MSLGHSVFAGVRAAGPREVLVCGRRRLTGDDVLEMVAGAAAALRARGIRRGDTIACMSGRQPETTVARLVMLALGCPVVHLLPGVRIEAAARTMRTLGTTVLLHEPCRQEDADRLLEAYPVPIVYRLDADLFSTPHGGLVSPPEVLPDELSAVAFTNGTTGGAKAVAYSQRAEAAHLAAARATFGPEPWRFLMPPGHYVPNQLALWALATGGTAVLVDDTEVGHEPEVIARERVTQALAGRPIELYDLAGRMGPVALGTGPGTLRLLLYGGAAAVPTRSMEVVMGLGPVALQCYGLTEAGFVTALSPLDHLRPDRVTSVGQPVEGVEVCVRDLEGRALRVGEIGEVWVRSPQLMSGYVGEPERTARTLRDGWVRTGDLGHLNADGYLFLVDRVENRLAEGVYAHPIEHVLTSHPAVADAAVFAVPHEGGHVVAGTVVRRADGEVDLDVLRALVRDSLGARCEPLHLWLIDKVPRTPGGKPDKAALRLRYEHTVPAATEPIHIAPITIEPITIEPITIESTTEPVAT
ncbi:AMP-binding protein [Nonomuraea sp. NPDC049152]|uniref:class I adenylate-forming enzyme family protein n=1 Tax=Nonomuraea sp. NPDC049152 TaxID=3154350 RepID=UPI0033F5C6CA